MKRRKPAPEPEARIDLELIADTPRAASLFGAMLRAVEMERKFREEEADGNAGSQKTSRN